MEQEHVQRIVSHIRQGAKPCIDSRSARKGDIFFALQGETRDGNRFAAEALRNGCAIACVDKAEFAEDARYILVNDVLAFLQQTATAYRRQLHIPVLGITGSNGKTTTKELIQQVLSNKYQSVATRGNLNNHIGVPLTILSIGNSTDIAVIEMGANHTGEISLLCRMAMPTHGLITNIGKAHMEGFGSIENIASAKKELFEYLHQTNGTLFVNTDDPFLKETANEKPQAITYGKNSSNHCAGEITGTHPFVNIRFSVHRGFGKAAKGMNGTIHSRLTGIYNKENILAAITTGLFFGVPPDTVTQAIEGYEPQNHRSQIIHTAKNTILMDAYNANPTSTKASLENFLLFPGKPKAVMLGDMLELGENAEYEHRAIRDMVLGNAFPLNIFVGNHFQTVCAPHTPNMHVFPCAETASRWLEQNPVEGYTILLKGSRGIQMEKLLHVL